MENALTLIKQEPLEDSLTSLSQTDSATYSPPIVKVEGFSDDLQQFEDKPEYVDVCNRDIFELNSDDYEGGVFVESDQKKSCTNNVKCEPIDVSPNESEDFNSDNSVDRSKGFIDKDDISKREDSSDDEMEGENTCRVCKLTFVESFDLEVHLKNRRLEDKKYKCCACSKTFRDNTQLKVHSRKHTGEKPFGCTVCGKRFSVNGNLNKHMRIHTGERRFECDVCERKFTQFAHLEDHMRTHSGDRPFVCDYCNAAFKTKARLRKHRKCHEEDKATKRSVKCPLCWRMLKNMKQLTTHMASHEASNELFSCTFCDKQFDKFKNMQAHQKTHSGMRGYQCHLCDKAFASASHLRRHINSHSGLRPYSCSVCHRAFPSAQNLKRHTMTHTGERPHSCELCGRAFLTLENLNRHKRTHTGEKPFSCDICGKLFAHSTTAKEHRRVHTGDKPFGCLLCEKRFSLSKMLYKHVREKHPEHFPEFKQLNSLPPNMKRAIEKVKRETRSVIKEEPIEHVFGGGSLEAASRVAHGADCEDKMALNDTPDIKIEKEETDET